MNVPLFTPLQPGHPTRQGGEEERIREAHLSTRSLGRFVTGFNREILSFHAAALILGAAALLSKLLGLVRDRLLAARFGAGDTLDVYYAAFQIPDILFTVFLVGAASAAVLPVFIGYERRGPAAAAAFVSNLLTVFGVLALIAAAAAAAFAPWLAAFVAPGFGAVKLAAVVGLTRLLLFNTVFLGIAGILSSVLQARRRFFVFALPPIVYNLGIIAGIQFAVPVFGLSGLAYGVLAGGVLQVLIQLPAFSAMRFSFRLRFDLAEAGLRRVAATSLPRVSALVMSQLTLVALAAIASFLAAGSISVFKFASNLLYVPVGLFGIPWALAVFPKLSDASLAREGEAFRGHVLLGVRNILFWTLPAAAMAVVLRAHIVRVVLGSGAFDWEDTRLVAAALAALALAIVSESILPLFLRAFYALGRTREPLLWDVVGSLFTVLSALGLLALASVRPDLLDLGAAALRIGDLPHPEIVAIASAFTLGSLLNVFLLGRALRRAALRELGVMLSFGGNALPAMGMAALAAGVAAYAALLPFPALIATNTLVGIFIQGAAAGAAGLIVYAAVLAWQKNPEMLAIIQSFQQRLLSPRKTPQVFETEKLDSEGAK